MFVAMKPYRAYVVLLDNIRQKIKFLCLCLCMYICMFVCTYVRMYVCVHACHSACVRTDICMYVNLKFLLVTRQNDNPSPGPGPGRLVPSSHQAEK